MRVLLKEATAETLLAEGNSIRRLIALVQAMQDRAHEWNGA
jgi:hypothetical protein